MLINKQGEWAQQPLPWHEEAFKKILATHRHQRLPHALMLIGPEGSGKQIFAATLIAAILCKQSDEAPCGHCNGCQLARAGNHGDARWLFPRQESERLALSLFVNLSDLCSKPRPTVLTKPSLFRRQKL